MAAIRYYPAFDPFRRLAATARWVPVYRRLLGDALTPVSAFHKIDAGSSACLFESVIGGEKIGRETRRQAGDGSADVEREKRARHRNGDARGAHDGPTPFVRNFP